MAGLANPDKLRCAVREEFVIDASVGGLDGGVVYLGGDGGAAAGDLELTCGVSAQDALPQPFGEAPGALTG